MRCATAIDAFSPFAFFLDSKAEKWGIIRVIMRLLARFAVLFSLLLPSVPAAALDLSISSGQWRPAQIAVEPFAGQESLPGQPFAEIIADDLHRSGAFLPRHLPAPAAESLRQTRKAGSEYLLSGSVRQSADRKGFTAAFQLTDAITEKEIGRIQTTRPARPQAARAVAHQMANWIYEKITDNPGVFHTKIAYVLRRPDPESGKTINELRVADYDGFNPMTALSSEFQLISPRFTPDGDALLYVSIEPLHAPNTRKPVEKPRVYWQSLTTGERRVVANFTGSNSAPAMSPDQQTIAAALTRHNGEVQIYLLDFPDIGEPRRLRESAGANTEPVFSPDGQRIAFTSDEGGAPHIYEHSLASGETRRLTFSGRNNAEPVYSANGNAIVFIQRDENGYNVALLDVASGESAPLTAIRDASSPSLAPNDQIVLFRNDREKKYLYTVSVNGKIALRWRESESGEIVDPVWGPAEAEWF